MNEILSAKSLETAAAAKPLRVAALGIGWWSDVLADAAGRSDKVQIVSCYTRSEDKRRGFATKYGCHAAGSYEEILADPAIEAIVNTTPNDAHLETTRAAAAAGKHVFLDKPIANNVSDGRAITEVCRKAGVVLIGDAFATSCPAAGTGARKVLTDVERLCNVYVPKWLATPGEQSAPAGCSVPGLGASVARRGLRPHGA